jgi:hypothetical protein
MLNILESNTEQPDDSARGGMITFDFASKVKTVDAIGLMDIDEVGTDLMVTYEDESGNKQTKTLDVPMFLERIPCIRSVSTWTLCLRPQLASLHRLHLPRLRLPRLRLSRRRLHRFHLH